MPRTRNTKKLSNKKDEIKIFIENFKQYKKQKNIRNTDIESKEEIIKKIKEIDEETIKNLLDDLYSNTKNNDFQNFLIKLDNEKKADNKLNILNDSKYLKDKKYLTEDYKDQTEKLNLIKEILEKQKEYEKLNKGKLKEEFEIKFNKKIFSLEEIVKEHWNSLSDFKKLMASILMEINFLSGSKSQNTKAAKIKEKIFTKEDLGKNFDWESLKKYQDDERERSSKKNFKESIDKDFVFENNNKKPITFCIISEQFLNQGLITVEHAVPKKKILANAINLCQFIEGKYKSDFNKENNASITEYMGISYTDNKVEVCVKGHLLFDAQNEKSNLWLIAYDKNSLKGSQDFIDFFNEQKRFNKKFTDYLKKAGAGDNGELGIKEGTGILVNKVIREDIILKHFKSDSIADIDENELVKFVDERRELIGNSYYVPKPEYYQDFIGIGDAVRLWYKKYHGDNLETHRILVKKIMPKITPTIEEALKKKHKFEAIEFGADIFNIILQKLNDSDFIKNIELIQSDENSDKIIENLVDELFAINDIYQKNTAKLKESIKPLKELLEKLDTEKDNKNIKLHVDNLSSFLDNDSVLSIPNHILNQKTEHINNIINILNNDSAINKEVQSDSPLIFKGIDMILKVTEWITLNQEVRDLKEKNEEREKEIKELKKELDEVKNKNKKELDEVKNKNKKELDEVKNKNKKELDEVKKELDEVKSKNKEEVAELKKKLENFGEQISRLNKIIESSTKDELSEFSIMGKRPRSENTNKTSNSPSPKTQKIEEESDVKTEGKGKEEEEEEEKPSSLGASTSSFFPKPK